MCLKFPNSLHSNCSSGHLRVSVFFFSVSCLPSRLFLSFQSRSPSNQPANQPTCVQMYQSLCLSRRLSNSLLLYLNEFLRMTARDGGSVVCANVSHELKLGEINSPHSALGVHRNTNPAFNAQRSMAHERPGAMG